MAPNPPLRDARGRLLPGQTANPKGRPRTGLALAETIREELNPVARRELVRRVIDIAMGRAVCIDAEWQRKCAEARAAGESMPPLPTEGAEVIQPDIPQQQRAQEWLATWAFEKPTQTVELTNGDTCALLDYSKLSREELDALEATLAKAAGIVDVPELEAPAPKR